MSFIIARMKTQFICRQRLDDSFSNDSSSVLFSRNELGVTSPSWLSSFKTFDEMFYILWKLGRLLVAYSAE